MARKYEMSRRAEQVEQTRLRITEAAVELHGSVGPARTTISAVAERAGVDRLTVYRHFPDEQALFAACSRHWRALNPPPDPARWAAIGDPAARLAQALDELYCWFRSTHPMLENVIRDRPFVPALDGPAAEREAFGEAMVRSADPRLESAAQRQANSRSGDRTCDRPDDLALPHPQGPRRESRGRAHVDVRRSGRAIFEQVAPRVETHEQEA